MVMQAATVEPKPTNPPAASPGTCVWPPRRRVSSAKPCLGLTRAKDFGLILSEADVRMAPDLLIEATAPDRAPASRGNRRWLIKC